MDLWLQKLIIAAIAVFSFLTELGCSQYDPNYTFMKDATSAPLISHYDYIIVGGGTAGCPLAATLSKHSTVLLLERGGSPYGNNNISNLAGLGDILSDLSPTSVLQRFVSEDSVINARARVLGGGSSINAGFYSRASPEDVRDMGWDGALVNESYSWVEKVVAFEPRVLQWSSALRDGLVEAGVGPNNGFTYDHMNGTKVGGTIFDVNGHRHGAADLLRYADPERLDLLLHATVDRILFEHKGVRRPVAQGVVFIDREGKKHQAYLKEGAKSELVLSAGALGSPQLLMLSGIGPGKHLRSLGIEVVLDQPMVGEGMADNPLSAVFVPSPVPVETALVQVVGVTASGNYIESFCGIDIFAVLGQVSSVPRIYPEQRSIEEANNLEDSPFRSGLVIEKVARPLSKGYLKLKSRDPYVNPSVTFNYFKEHADVEKCVEGLKTIERVIQTKAFSKFKYSDITVDILVNVTANFLHPEFANTSISLEKYCKTVLGTIWHYHGGCQVGHVVDHDYKVLGVDSLRVIDGSTFNFSPGTNPQATVMMLGRYMGVKIQNQSMRINGAL